MEFHEDLLCTRAGRSSKHIQSYDVRGGNVEILEHFGAGLLELFVNTSQHQNNDKLTPEQWMRKSRLIDKLRTYVERENEHARAALLLEFMGKGGRLDALVRYVEKGAAGNYISNEVLFLRGLLMVL